MKLIRYCFTITVLLLLSSISYLTTAQTKWYKYPGKRVYHGGENGWQRQRSQKAIIYENGQYKMWYSTFNKNDVNILGYATSTDGINWEGFEGDSINFECVDESLDSRFNDFDIIKIDTAYLMWYTLKVNENNVTCLGFAWSKDGMDWTKYPEPVLKHGEDDEWDAHGPCSISVIFDGNLFRMLYGGYDKSRPAIERIGLAISRDGIHWDKHPANPLLVEGEPGSWDDQGVELYSVVFNGSNYELWYSGDNFIHMQIGHASSNNGIHWTKSSENPVLRNGKLGERDSRYIHSPEVVHRDSVYRMWYYGSDSYRRFQGYATTSVDEFLAWDTATIIKPQREIRVKVFGRMEYVKVDSLTDILPELSGIDLIDAYNMLAMAYSQNDETKSSYYADKALELADKANYPEGRAMALYSKGNCQVIMDNYGIALANYLSSLLLYDSLDMLFEKVDLLLCIAGIQNCVGSRDLSISNLRQALLVSEQINDTSFILWSLNFLGYVYLGIGDTTNALETFKRKLDLEKQTPKIRKQIPKINAIVANYETLGLCYSGRILDSALYYFNKAIIIWDSLGSGSRIHTNNYIADAYFAAGPEYYKEAEEYYLKYYNRYWYSYHPLEVGILNSMAELYLCTGRYDKCREFLDVSLNTCRLWLSRLEHQLFSNDAGKSHYELYLKSKLEKIYRLYFRLDTTLNNETSALKHYMLATQYKDSIYNDQNKKQWAMLQGQFKTEKTQNQITMLKKENEVKNLTLKKSRIYLFGLGALVLIIILGAIIFIRNRKIRAQHAIELERVKSEKLQELDHLKSRFFANISHEFRTPLTLILGPLEKLLSKVSDDADQKELKIAKKYANNLQNLINHLLTISKLESGKMRLHAAEINIVKLINGYLQAFESLAKQKNIGLNFISENEEIKAFIDREKFEQVLNNLLSNAFKFTDEGGRIEISITPLNPLPMKNRDRLSRGDLLLAEPVSKRSAESPPFRGDGRGVQIKISDTGCGIPPEHIDHVFDRFYQVEREEGSYYQGTGIGLALTKELVELHHGEINVESEVGKGSTFKILLPLGKDHLKKEEIAEQNGNSKFEIRNLEFENFESKEIDHRIEKNSIEPEEAQPILLIVEDNADMLSYIRGYFEAGFRIIEAADGVDGYEKSVEQIPDIIISDVMMPKMDGNVFCRKVKTDERTSHIPVILLTARASKESRIEGLETGADDFITKPFDGDELQVRVKNLIQQRQRIRKLLEEKIQKSHSVIQIDFADSGITSMDEQFLQKVIEIVKEHHTDPEFNTKAFGRAIGLGRIQLNRKIKALTGQTTVSFIRTFRLNHAAELIKKKSATVAEIAYDVGFNSPSYFTECFRIYFGKLPSEMNLPAESGGEYNP